MKKLKTVLTFGPPSTIVAALCLLSTSKFADDKLSGEVVEDMLKKSFGEHQVSVSRVSLTAVSSSSRFKAWCAAAGLRHHQCHQTRILPNSSARKFLMNSRSSRCCASASGVRRRQLPVSPDTFDGEIAHKHATNGSDVDFSKKKFRQTFRAVMGACEEHPADERSGSAASAVAPLPRSHFVRVSEARSRGPLEE